MGSGAEVEARGPRGWRCMSRALSLALSRALSLTLTLTLTLTLSLAPSLSLSLALSRALGTGELGPGIGIRGPRPEARGPRLRLTLIPYEGARKARDMGWRGRAKCQSAWLQPPPIGAPPEARLAWPDPPCSSGHLCKPSRPVKPPSRFSETLMNDSLRKKGSDNQCTQETRPEDKRGSASPRGEARRECAAKAERSEVRVGTLLTRVRVILGLCGGGG